MIKLNPPFLLQHINNTTSGTDSGKQRNGIILLEEYTAER